MLISDPAPQHYMADDLVEGLTTPRTLASDSYEGLLCYLKSDCDSEFCSPYQLSSVETHGWNLGKDI